MLKFEQFAKRDYTQKQLDNIMNLIIWYDEKQTKEIALLLIDLAGIYVNSLNE
jgi:hypothetical protein